MSLDWRINSEVESAFRKIPESLLAVVDGFIAKGSSPDLLINEVVRVTEAKAKRPEPAQIDA